MLFCYDFLCIFPASPVSFLLTLSQLRVLPQTSIFLKIAGWILSFYFPLSKCLVFLEVNSYILMTLITYWMFKIYKQNLSPDLSTELLYIQLSTWVIYSNVSYTSKICLHSPHMHFIPLPTPPAPPTIFLVGGICLQRVTQNCLRQMEIISSFFSFLFTSIGIDTKPIICSLQM